MIRIRELNNEEVNEMINRYNRNGNQVDIFEGTLLDDYIIHDVEKKELCDMDTILIKGEIINEWSSEYVLYYGLHSDDIIQDYYY